MIEFGQKNRMEKNIQLVGNVMIVVIGLIYHQMIPLRVFIPNGMA